MPPTWPTKNRRLIGNRVPRLDGPDKATGRAKYSYDINRPGLLHARILRCPHAHARIRSIDTRPAEQTAGFRAVYPIAAANAEMLYAGQEVLPIAADTEEHVDDCIRAVRVEYEVLPHLVKEEDALRPNAPITVGGNQPNARVANQSATDNFDEQAFQGAAAVVETTYGVPTICHQCLESHGLVAAWNADQTE